MSSLSTAHCSDLLHEVQVNRIERGLLSKLPYRLASQGMPKAIRAEKTKADPPENRLLCPHRSEQAAKPRDRTRILRSIPTGSKSNPASAPNSTTPSAAPTIPSMP